MDTLNAKSRKERPLFSGVLKYFPDALMEVAYASFVGNKQHLEGKPLQWDRTKSMDQMEACMRHITDHAKGEIKDTDGAYHLAKACWRLCAHLQIMIEDEKQNEI